MKTSIGENAYLKVSTLHSQNFRQALDSGDESANFIINLIKEYEIDIYLIESINEFKKICENFIENILQAKDLTINGVFS